MAAPDMLTNWSLLLVEDEEENADEESDAGFEESSMSCKVILPSELSSMLADIHPHCSLLRSALIMLISLSLSPKGSRCVAKDATVPPPIDDVYELFFMYGAEAIDMAPLKEDPPLPKEVGFRAILSLNDNLGLRAASTADLLTQTLVPLLLLVLYEDLIVGDFGPCELAGALSSIAPEALFLSSKFGLS